MQPQDIVSPCQTSPDPIVVLYLPHRSSSIRYRAYLEDAGGGSILQRYLAEQSEHLPSWDRLVLFHDDADEDALSRCGDEGLFAVRSLESSASSSLAEVALAFPGRPVIVTSIENALAPPCLAQHALRLHQTTGSALTRMKGLPAEVCPEVFAPEALAALHRRSFPGNPGPGVVLLHLAEHRGLTGGEPVRIEEFDVSNLFGSPEGDLPARVSFDTAHEAARALRAMELPCDGGYGRLAAYRDALPPRISPGASVARTGSRRRILYFTPSCGFSGAEQSLAAVVPHLNTEFEQFAVVGFEGVLSDKLTDGGCTTWAANIDLRAPGTEETAADVLRWADPDLVHLNGSAGEPMYRELLQAGVPFVVHARVADVVPLEPELRAATAVVAVSDFTRREVQKLQVDSARIHTIYNGVDLSQFREELFDKAAIRRSCGIPASAVCALMVATPEPRKRYDLFFEAGARLLSELPNSWLILVGEGGTPHAEEQIEAAMRQPPFEGRVIRFRFERDIRRLLSACDVLVLPSEREALARCVLEAMAMRRPVVVTDSGGTVEVVTEGVTGSVVRSGDADVLFGAMARLLSDEQLRMSQGEAARRAAEAHLAVEQSARRLAEVLRQAIRQRGE